MTDEEAKRICPLYTGGYCPHSYDLYEGYPENTSKKDNEECCAYHYQPTEEDIEEMFPNRKKKV